MPDNTALINILLQKKAQLENVIQEEYSQCKDFSPQVAAELEAINNELVSLGWVFSTTNSTSTSTKPDLFSNTLFDSSLFSSSVF